MFWRSLSSLLFSASESQRSPTQTHPALLSPSGSPTCVFPQTLDIRIWKVNCWHVIMDYWASHGCVRKRTVKHSTKDKISSWMERCNETLQKHISMNMLPLVPLPSSYHLLTFWLVIHEVTVVDILPWQKCRCLIKHSLFLFLRSRAITHSCVMRCNEPLSPSHSESIPNKYQALPKKN